MNEIAFVKEEIAELEAQIFRIRNSMNRADNGVKLKKLAVISRLRDRCLRWLSALERRNQEGAAA